MATNVSVLIKQSVIDKKNTLSQVSVSVPPPPREIYFVDVHLYSKELYNIADSPTYVEYQQTL